MLQLEAERRIRDCHDAVGGIGYVGTVPVLEVVDRPLKNWRAVAKLNGGKTSCSARRC